MSQENHPQYNYSDSYPKFFSPKPPNSSLQWAQQRPVGLEHPSTRVRSNVDTFSRRTPSASRSASFNYPQPNPSQRGSQIDPNLHLLNVPHQSSSRSRVDILPQNPIQRFYIAADDAWTPERSLGSFNNPAALPRDSNFPSQPGPNLDYVRYRNPPGSEIESNGTAPFHSDSGYGTAPATHSVGSIEPVDYGQDVPADVSIQLENINFTGRTNDPVDMSRSVRSDRSDQLKIRPSHRKAQKCPHCEEVPKCPSDYKKHILKHEKPHRCDVRGCRRGLKGFTTVNDLNRHKKSVHRIGSTTKSYRCASENCRNKEKIWPRLDNFKQHVNRMHADEDGSELIRLSEYHGRQPSSSPTPQPMSVAPMDTTLAGMEKHPHLSIPSFSNSGNLCLTPENNPRWENLEISPHEFDMDGNPPDTNHEMYAPGSQQADLGMNTGYRPTDQGQSTGLGSSTPSSWRGDATSPNVSLGLNTLAAVACSAPPQSSPESVASNKQFQRLPALSREPQTKAEQQKRALGHLTSYIAANIPNNPKGEEIDKAVWRLLSRATGWEGKDSGLAGTSGEVNGMSSNQLPVPASQVTRDASKNTEGIQDTITRTEVLRGLAELAKLIKQKGKKNSAVNSRHRPLTNLEMCEVCDKAVPRRCDLKKHMKRHTRPYGCTFPKCKKKFGSKNDWKRHENSQHFQLETWRCQLDGPNQACCAELFYRKEMFEEHLKVKHGMIDNSLVTQEIKRRRIGRNGQGHFWCGFCKDIIPLEHKRNAAWDERFNHIDNHFSKESKKIEEWLCLEAKKTKGEVLKEMDKNNFDEDDEVGMEDGNDDVSPPESQASLAQQSSSSGEGTSPSANSEGQASGSSNPRKRHRSAEPHTSRPGRRDILSYCCRCNLGPFANKIYATCMECDHPFCPMCPQKLFINDENGLDLDIFSYST